MWPRSAKWIALSFCLLTIGFFFVKKRTGERTLWTEVPRYIHWLPSGMMDLADHKNCAQIRSTAPSLHPAGPLQCPAYTYSPLHCQQDSSVPSQPRGEAGEQAAPALHTQPGHQHPPSCTQENWSSPALELTPVLLRGWTSLGSWGESIDVDTGCFF